MVAVRLFVRISTGHAHFRNDEMHIPRMPMRPSTLYFSCRMPEKLTRKAGLEVRGWSYARFSIGKGTHLQGSAYQCVSVI